MVPSRVRHLNAESNVQTRIIQFQRNASVTAIRALYNTATKGQPLVLGPSQPHPTETTTTLALPSQSQVTTADNGLLERLDTLQQYFDQSLHRALQTNANQFRTLQTHIQTFT